MDRNVIFSVEVGTNNSYFRRIFKLNIIWILIGLVCELNLWREFGILSLIIILPFLIIVIVNFVLVSRILIKKIAINTEENRLVIEYFFFNEFKIIDLNLKGVKCVKRGRLIRANNPYLKLSTSEISIRQYSCFGWNNETFEKILSIIDNKK